MSAKRIIIKSLSPIIYFGGFVGVLLALMYVIGEHIDLPIQIWSNEETWFILGLGVLFFVLLSLNISIVALEQLTHPRLRDHIRHSILLYIVGTAAYLERALNRFITRTGSGLMAIIFMMCAFGIAVNFIFLLIKRTKSKKVSP
ncbi:MAG: hypothetical protein HYV34_03535 [Candidatus Kerfeldbacteria bacterium]|nr:hypothetical protein [Candidatus Kerfeldbacteria bacterium]